MDYDVGLRNSVTQMFTIMVSNTTRTLLNLEAENKFWSWLCSVTNMLESLTNLDQNFFPLKIPRDLIEENING